MINKEFSATESPANTVNPLFDGTPGVARGSPVFDDTPLPVRSAVVAGILDSGERTAGPVFDSTPLQQDNVETDAVPESTPVWQDTQSQTVDGTEEVTQAHQVEEQISKYNEQHAARVSRFNEDLKLYYRKYPHKKPNVEAQAATADETLEEISEPQPVCKKDRVAVRKTTVKFAGVSPSRRSPRFALDADAVHVESRGTKRSLSAATDAVSPSRRSPRLSVDKCDRHDQSLYTVKSRGVKRSRATDKTYVPDQISEDDSSDFEDKVRSFSSCFIYIFFASVIMF